MSASLLLTSALGLDGPLILSLAELPMSILFPLGRDAMISKHV